MALLPKARRDPGMRLVAFALASGVPLACYLATASAHSYWLDSGELAAASVHLGIAHPPGHPLESLVGRLVSYLPLGPLQLRVALASALSAAIAAGFLFRAAETTVRSLGVVRDRISIPLALGATWLVAGSYGWWFQAVRPEVYALQAMIVMIALERIVALEAAWPTQDVRPLFVASFAIGLGLANHHFLAILVLPAIAPTLARVRRARGDRPLLVSAAALALGLSTYVYLPIRSGTSPAIDLGHPTTPETFFWVVSAEAFQKNTGEGVPLTLAERFADVLVQIVENLHAVPVLLALAGAYALLRTPGARRIGFVWIATLLIHVAARAWLGWVRSNPDALGYLMPGFAALGVLAAAFVAALLAAVGGATREQPRRTAVLVAVVVAALGLAQIDRSASRSSLASFTATDVFDDALRRDLPPRAVVVAHAPQTVFRHWDIETSERVRPDVIVIPMPFVTYPGMVASLVERSPDVGELLRGYLLEGELRQPDLQSLAAERPLLVEMDVRVPRALYETLVPRGLYHEVLADGATDTDEAEGAETWRAAWQRIDARIGAQRSEPETRNQLLWRRYVDALYFASFGDRASAREAVSAGLAINPESPELRGLEAALAKDETGPLDVAPFVVGGVESVSSPGEP